MFDLILVYFFFLFFFHFLLHLISTYLYTLFLTYPQKTPLPDVDKSLPPFPFFSKRQKTSLSNVYRTVEPTDPNDPNALDPNRVPGIPTSIVNGTAPQPKVLLRIVDKDGNDITGDKIKLLGIVF